MINAYEVKDFTNSHVGLISPNGEFFAVSPYAHFSKLKQYPEFAQDVERHENNISDMYQSFSDSIPEDEHPCWHIYEIGESNAHIEFRAEILEKAYKLGWVRVGYYYKTLNHKILEIEGNTQGIKNAIKLAKHLADKIECLDLLEVNIDNPTPKGKKQQAITTW